MATTLIHNGTLIDGTGGDPIPNGAVLIEDGRITAAGAQNSISVPAGAARVDAQGGTIMPGFIDTHVHIMFEYENPFISAQTPFSMRFYKAAHYMRKTIDAGITTVRDAGGADLGTKQAQQQGLVTGPRLMISTAPLGITGGHSDNWLPSGTTMELFPAYPGMPSGICDGVAEVRKRAREVLRAGADVIKIMATGGVLSPTDHPEFVGFSEDELAAVVEEGRKRRGVKVMAHAQGLEGIKMAVRAGVHSIEHGIYLDDEVCDMMIEAGTYVVPTLLAPIAVVEMAEATGAIPEYGLRKARETIEAHRESIALAVKKGVKIAMGTDAGVMPHGTNLRELGLMASCGMSPMDVIVATTKTAAACMEWDDQLGTLEPGKLADVVVSRTDPLQDLTSLEDTGNITLVMQGGYILKDVRQD
ncbi:MAG: amidohydrolase family protein [Phototrophicaceae bacterium]